MSFARQAGGTAAVRGKRGNFGQGRVGVPGRSFLGLGEVVKSREHAGVVLSLASTLITAGRRGGGGGGGTLTETYWLIVFCCG